MDIGDWVKIGYWVGRIEDVLISDERALYLVSSPKGVWRNLFNACEWVEAFPDVVDIMPATEEEIDEDVRRYTHLIEKQLEKMEEMFGKHEPHLA